MLQRSSHGFFAGGLMLAGLLSTRSSGLGKSFLWECVFPPSPVFAFLMKGSTLLREQVGSFCWVKRYRLLGAALRR